MEEGHAEQGRGLKCSAKPDTQVAVLDLGEGAGGDPGPRRQLVLRPAPLTPRKPDPGTQQTSRVNGVRRVGAQSFLGHIGNIMPLTRFIELMVPIRLSIKPSPPHPRVLAMPIA